MSVYEILEECNQLTQALITKYDLIRNDSFIQSMTNKTTFDMIYAGAKFLDVNTRNLMFRAAIKEGYTVKEE